MVMQKYWVHEKTRCNCFMLFARALSITWSDDPSYWIWHPVKETKYVVLQQLNMHAQFKSCLYTG